MWFSPEMELLGQLRILGSKDMKVEGNDADGDRLPEPCPKSVQLLQSQVEALESISLR